MKTSKTSYRNTNRFNQLVLDYLDQKAELSQFVTSFPNIEEFNNQIERKKRDDVDRSLLFDVLKSQNKNINLSKKSANNLTSLKEENTFTVTTGHQLCLFTGPLYFIYKIISTINLASELSVKYPENNFVPIFWLASEDHDFDEISSINIYNKKINWERESTGGPVGKMDITGIDSLIKELTNLISKNPKSSQIIDLLNKSYSSNKNLTEATRFLINSLFGKYGLLIIDGDDSRLKSEIADIIDEDINNNTFYSIIKETNKKLTQNYHTQAYVRPINFFKISENKRERISCQIDKKEIVKNPYDYSPNVLLRPIYQEKILPNIAYVGGGAEISYWLQLKEVFRHLSISFPILVMRNSVMVIDSKQKSRIEKLNLLVDDFFESIDLINKKYLNSIDDTIDFKDDFKNLDLFFESLQEKINDKNLISSLAAIKKKTNNSIEDFQKKVIKSLKEKKENEIQQIKKVSNILFPNNQLQERHENFISMYLKYGDNFIENLISILDPLDSNFVILELESEK